jgi:hypothetical protein
VNASVRLLCNHDGTREDESKVMTTTTFRTKIKHKSLFIPEGL